MTDAISDMRLKWLNGPPIGSRFSQAY